MQVFLVFNTTSKLFSGTKYPTANLYLIQVWSVKHMLNTHLASDDEYMRKMAALCLSNLRNIGAIATC